MRVIAGTARGRKLVAPAGRATRPITDRAKEGIFNMLESLGGVDDAVVADLYAGSGSFGIECLSRGARWVTFVERSRPAVAAIRANLDRLAFGDRAAVVAGPVEAALGALGPLDVAFCDPPYAEDPWSRVLAGLEAGLVVAHAETPVDLPPTWAALRRRRYGRANIVIACPAERPSPEQTGRV
jgi:16S rRNA (guanine966-N2)-methyltransferase